MTYNWLLASGLINRRWWRLYSTSWWWPWKETVVWLKWTGTAMNRCSKFSKKCADVKLDVLGQKVHKCNKMKLTSFWQWTPKKKKKYPTSSWCSKLEYLRCCFTLVNVVIIPVLTELIVGTPRYQWPWILPKNFIYWIHESWSQWKTISHALV